MAIVVALNPTYTERELENALVSTGASIVVTLTPFYQRVKNIQSRTAVRHVVATSIKEYLPPALRLLFTLFKEKKDGHRISLATDDTWLQDAAACAPLVAATRDVGAVRTTGPSSFRAVERPGHPKVSSGFTVTTSRRVDSCTNGRSRALKPWVDPIMLPLPMFHVYANVGVQPLAFVAPSPLSLVPNPRDIGDLLKTIRQVRPAFFNGIPTLYNAILNHPDVRAGKVDLRSIKLCFSGAAALMAETKRQFEHATGARIVEGYSLTEAMMACCVNPVKGPNKIGSIGLPLPDVDVRIVDAEQGEREVPPGEAGELILRAPQLMTEYWNNPAETANALRNHGQGGPWLHTGDLAYMDDEGYLFLVDRKKDMLKTSGFQVWPREIEEILATSPGRDGGQRRRHARRGEG